MVRFTVVIPTWKNTPYLDLAVRSVREHSAVDHEIIVFFNEFDEASAAWLSAHDVPHDSAPQNVGVCEAVNRAARMAGTDYICFMNDDMYALPGWDTALAGYLGMADKLWLSGTAIEAGKATPCYIGNHGYGGSVEAFEEQRLLREFRTLRRPYNVVSTWTPTLIPKTNWDAVGGFDEKYFPGRGSDPDLAMKMYRFGCRHFIGVGSSLVYHFSRRTISRFDAADTMDPKALFEEKWGMPWKRFLNRVIYRDRVVTPRLMARLLAR